MQHIPVNMRRLIKSTAQKAVYEIWKKQVKRQMPKCLLISSYTAFFVRHKSGSRSVSLVVFYEVHEVEYPGAALFDFENLQNRKGASQRWQKEKNIISD